jgi:hypothetical protein
VNRKHCALPILLAGILLAAGCDTSARISKLERENGEFKSQLAKVQAANNYDLQEKCARDGKEWLRDNWRNDKDTIFMTYNNHYNGANNACFMVVERHVKSIFGDDGSWSNIIELWDVLENNKYASIQDDHLVHFKPQYSVGDDVVSCEVAGKKCASLDEFNKMTRPYLSN